MWLSFAALPGHWLVILFFQANASLWAEGGLAWSTGDFTVGSPDRQWDPSRSKNHDQKPRPSFFMAPQLSPGCPEAVTLLTLHFFNITLKKANQLVCAWRIYQAHSKICFVFTAVLTCLDDAISKEIAWCNAGDSTIVILLTRTLLWSQWKSATFTLSLDPIYSNHLHLRAGLGLEITTSCSMQTTSPRHPQLLQGWRPRRWHSLEETQLQLSWQVLDVWKEMFS